jgi:hypothetical protein
VRRFSSTPPAECSSLSAGANTRARSVASNMIMTQSNFLSNNPIYDEDSERLKEVVISKSSSYNPKGNARLRKAGVVPVQVDMIKTGQNFFFERPLTVSETFFVNTTVLQANKISNRSKAKQSQKERKKERKKEIRKRIDDNDGSRTLFCVLDVRSTASTRCRGETAVPSMASWPAATSSEGKRQPTLQSFLFVLCI